MLLNVIGGLHLFKNRIILIVLGIISILAGQDSYEGYTLFTPGGGGGGGGGATTYLKDNDLNNF